MKILEFFTVFLLVTVFLFSPLITFSLILLLSWFWSFPKVLFLCLIYGSWIYIDRHTDSRGGRWSSRLRRLSICSTFTNYFPMKLIKSADLDPNRNYIFGYHPHGFFSLGAVGNFCTEGTNFSELFPNLRSHLMLLHLQFIFPLTRELFLLLGACCVSRESCEYLLNGSSGLGNVLVIVIGGIPEMKLTKDQTMILYLKKRKGFVRLALQHGASLVPVISFGENELYHRYGKVSWGRFLLGYLPRRHPINTIIGEPIDVKQILDPSPSDIDELHQKYLRAVEKLFDQHKINYACKDLQLDIK